MIYYNYVSASNDFQLAHKLFICEILKNRDYLILKQFNFKT